MRPIASILVLLLVISICVADNCPVITTSGAYTMTNGFSGAPNDASDYSPGYSACVEITSSDVVFDCNGSSITNDDTTDALGIFVDGFSNPLTNVTIRNCPGISGYDYGIAAFNTSASTFVNISASDNNNEGFHMESGSNNTITGSVASDNGENSISLAGEANDTVSNNLASGSSNGIVIGPAASRSGLNYTLYTGACMVTDNGDCTFSYDVASNNTFVVLMLSSGLSSIDLNSMPDGCTQQELDSGGDGDETGYIATCTQNSSSYDVTVNGDDSYVSFAAYVFAPGDYNFDTDSASTSSAKWSDPASLNLSLPSGSDIYLCDGADGNEVLSSESGTLDASMACSSDDCKEEGPISGVWHQSDSVCSASSDNSDLDLVGIGVSRVGGGGPPAGNEIFNNTIYNNTVSSDDVGVSITAGLSNNVLSNSLSDSSDGIDLDSSTGTNISGNEMPDFTSNGIYMSDSSGSIVTGNNMSGALSGGSKGGGCGGSVCPKATLYGINAESSDANLFSSNSITNISNAGINTDSGNGNTFFNNSIVFNNGFSGQTGFSLSAETGDALDGNVVLNASNYGFDIESGSSNNITNNTANSSGADGFYLHTESGDVLAANMASNASYNGFDIESGSGNNLAYNAANYSGNNGFNVYTESGDVLANNTASYTTNNGFDIESGSGNNLTGNNASSSGGEGFIVAETSDVLTGNKASYTTNYGFLIESTSGIILTDNTLTNNIADHSGWYGFEVYMESGDNITNNLAYNNSYGLDMQVCNNETLSGNLFKDNDLYGIVTYDTNNDTISNNTVDNTGHQYLASNQYFDYAGTPFDDGGSGDTQFIQDAGKGPCAVISDPNDSIASCYGFNGTGDISVALITIHPSSGDYQETYMVNKDFNSCSDVDSWWNSDSPGYPETCSYACVLYTANGPGDDYTLNTACLSPTANVSGGLSYPPYIVSGPDGPAIQLYTSTDNLIYNNIFNASIPATDDSGGENSWNITQTTGPNIIGGKDLGGNYYADYTGIDTDGDGIGNVPDSYNISVPSGSSSTPSVDYLPLTNTNNASGNCQMITEPGDYNMSSDYTGAPNDVSAVSSDTNACVYVDASNVTFDCQGHNITNDGTSSAAGIVIDSSATNVTIQDCVVSSYDQGIAQLGDASYIVDNTVSNTTIGIVLEGSSNNTLSGNTISSSQYGFYSDEDYNNTFLGNTAYNNSVDGFYLYGTVSDNFTGNTAYNDTGDGFFINTTTYSIFVSNTAYNDTDGFSLYPSIPRAHPKPVGGGNSSEKGTGTNGGTPSSNLFIENAVFNNTQDGFELLQAFNNTLLNNNATDNAGDGFYLDSQASASSSDSNNLTGNTADNNLGYGFELDAATTNTLDSDIAILNNESGFYLQGPNPHVMCHGACVYPSFNDLINDFAGNNTVDGFDMYAATSNTLQNDTALGNNGSGFEVVASDTNLLMADNATFNQEDGFLVDFTGSIGNNNLSSDFASYNGIIDNSGNASKHHESHGFATGCGFNVIDSQNNSLDNDTALSNENFGFILEPYKLACPSYAGCADTAFNSLTDSLAEANPTGFEVDFSDNNTFANDTVSASDGAGFNIYDSDNTSMGSDHFYSNNPDFQISEDTGISPISLSMTNEIFDNPAGDMTNYTNISINDQLLNESYSINWTANESALPADRTSFAGKFVNITANISGIDANPVSIDSIVWSWQDSELGSNYTESRFELWKYNESGWSMLNSTPDTSADTLSLTDFAPGSDYGILSGLNQPPTQGTPILNSTYGTNTTSENLTVYNQSTFDADGDSVKNIVDWRLDSNSIAVLNLPFADDSNSTWTKDYSTYGNNMTVVGATFNATGGPDGFGAYHFDGIDDYMIINGSNFNDTTLGLRSNFTVEVWYRKLAHTSGYSNFRIADQWNTGANPGSNQWLLSGATGSSDDSPTFGVEIGPTGYFASASSPVTLNTWYHLVGTFNGSAVSLYIDGVLNQMTPTPLGSFNDVGRDLKVGTEFVIPTHTNMDLASLRIYNRSLSSAQVQALFDNRTDLMVSQELKAGDTWQACMTPNDGQIDGNTSCSNNVTILGTNQNCPIITASGVYTQGQDYSGAPNDVSAVSSDTNACVYIQASNVTFDCQGHSITNDGTSSAAGIVIDPAATNVTIQDCVVSSYDQGIAQLGDAGYIVDNSVSNTTIGVVLEGSSNNTLSGNTISSSQYGFYSDEDYNNTFLSNTAYGSSKDGFYLYGSVSDNFTGNTAYNNSGDGFGINTTTYSIFSGNSAYNDTDGFSLYPSNVRAHPKPVGGNNSTEKGTGTNGGTPSSNLFIENAVFNNSQNGFEMYQGINNTLLGNNATDNGADGFYLDSQASVSSSDSNNLTGNNAVGNLYNGFELDAATTNTLDSDTAVLNNVSGFNLEGPIPGRTCHGACVPPSSNILTNDIATNNTVDGFYLYAANTNTVQNDTALGNNGTGFEAHASYGNLLMADDASYNLENGFMLDYSDDVGNNLTGDFASNNGIFTGNNATRHQASHGYTTGCGFDMVDTQSNSLDNDTALANVDYGFMLETNTQKCPANGDCGSTASNNLTDNLAEGNPTGFEVDLAFNDTFSNNTVSGSYYTGFSIYDSDNISMGADHLFNNDPDFTVAEDTGISPINLNMTGEIFDNPAGDMQNFTNLSVYDTPLNDSYSMNWSAQPDALPGSRSSFAGKFVNITANISGIDGNPVSIQSITWSWLDSELGSSSESRFELWKYNESGWSMLNSTPDTSANMLSLSGFSPGSDYGILGGLNPPPTQGTPILNSTYGTNTTSENLTVYNQSTFDPNGYNVTNIISWYVNSSPLMVLNMPFDTNVSNALSGAVEDYSGLGDNGTIGGGNPADAPTWTGSGQSGGAYIFDGVSDYIALQNTIPGIQSSNYTLSAWIRKSPGTDWERNNIFDQESSDGTHEIRLELTANSCNASFVTYENYDYGQINGGPSLCDGNWHLVTAVKSGTTGYLYVDGTLQSSGAVEDVTSTTAATIGALRTSDLPHALITYHFSGAIDDVRVYNRSLSSVQVQALFDNRTDLIVSNELHGGDVWQACMTPNDGQIDGNTSCSNNVTILGTNQNCPIITASGVYTQGQDYSGAPNDVSAVSSDTNACVYIQASNVTFDCQGHSITNDGTSSAAGIVIDPAATNVTIQDCVVSSYDQGIAQLGDAGYIVDNSVSNTTIGIVLEGSSNNTLSGNTISSSQYGFYSDEDYNNTFLGNTAYNNSVDGFYLYGTVSDNFTGNTAYNDTGDGFFINTTTYSIFVSNTAYNDTDGFSLYPSIPRAHPKPVGGGNSSEKGTGTNGGTPSSNLFIENAVFNNTQDGFELLQAFNNTLLNNNATDNAGDGFYLDSQASASSSDSNNLTGNTADNNLGYGFELDAATTNTLDSDIAILNNESGFYLQGPNPHVMCHGACVYPSFNDLINDFAGNNTVDGFDMYAATSNTLQNDTALGNNGSGFEVVASDTNLLMADNATFNQEDGFLVDFTGSIGNNNLSSDFASYNGIIDNSGNASKHHESHGFATGCGFNVIDSQNNSLDNDTALSNENFGFILEPYKLACPSYAGCADTAFNSLTDSLAEANPTGFEVDFSDNNTFANDTVSASDGAGFNIYDSDNTSMGSDHFYSNNPDFQISEDTGISPISLSMTNKIFDNPAGDMTNYTNISINDQLLNESYSINWTANESALPADRTSFAGKFVNITANISGIDANPVSIDSIVWSWQDSELSGYNASKFELWKYNESGWSKLSSTIATHALSQANLVPSSIYGLLENQQSSAMTVTLQSPGSGSIAPRRLITFNCSANSSVGLSNVTLYANFSGTWQDNQTNMVSGSSNSTSFALNLPYAQYSWNCLAYDTNGDYAWAPANYTFTADSLPIYSDFGGSTTDFTSEADLENVSTPILENTSLGKLQWNNDGLNVSGANFNAYVLFSLGSVSVDSSHLSPTLDSSANITLYNLPYQYTPVVYSDGALCTNCDILSYENHDLAFTVPHFTNYSVGPNSELAIYSEFEGGSIVNQTPITFYANYTNVTNGAHISGATCLISFDDATSGTMTDSGTQYTYLRNTPFTTPGSHPWNVTCSQVGFETLNATDNLASGNTVNLYGANITNETIMPRWGGNSSGNLSTQGGNITEANLSATTLTGRWAALFGNVSGSVLLGDDASHIVYTWAWNASNGGIVCASTNSSLSTFLAFPGYSSEIDNAWGFAGTAGDSANNTFTGRNCSMNYGPTTISGADYADTGVPGGFETCAFKSYTSPDKAGLLFCSDIIDGGQLYNGQKGDFEMIVPTTPAAGASETYYMYMSVN